ncbi:MAG: hypothetical protein A2031_03235 [Deltaproteobacteria bacterium RBG_19FT_COMBO_43_11]|nr:MAG: hypothetical protein A2031_03235 [Deltaproteobacteria bacterium RBG_19FT_COMBO_43_11]
MPKIKLSIVWGIFITLVFLTLLVIRLELFQKKSGGIAVVQKAAIQRPAETWMNIYQKEKKIGFVQRKFIILETGGFQTKENVIMQINTMGIIQALQISTETALNPDMSFSSFNFDLNSSLFRFNARGYVAQDKLILFTGLPSAQQKSEIPLKDIPYIGGNVYEAAFAAGMEKDATRPFSIFDPSTRSIRAIKVTREADEVIPIMGKRVLTQKFCADFMGAKNCAWLGKDSEILKETGLLGLSMEKVSPEKAREGIASDSSIDFAQIASITSNINITNPEKLTEIKIKITGIRDLFFLLNGGRQNFRQGIMTITKENFSSLKALKNKPPEEINQYLQPSVLVQSNHPQIKAQAQKIVLPTDNSQQKMRKIVNWVYINIEKKPVLSVPNALEILNNKTGDCNEHAVLTAALLRAAGLPAQIETGLIYLNGRFYYHAWNIVYIGQWITTDSVFNQIPADVTHIRLVRGEGGEQLNLLGVMGKIQLEVLSIKND